VFHHGQGLSFAPSAMALAFGAVPDSQVGPVFRLKTSWLIVFIYLVEGFAANDALRRK
jgi:hypothetical protein